MNNEDKILAMLDILAQGQIRIENELADLKGIVIRIENDHGRKLDALFDGYQQNASKLDRIEEKVQQQDEFILRRIK